MDVLEKMQKVLELAEEALKLGEIPIAAILFHGDAIVSQAIVSEKADRRYLAHAEMKALLDMDQQNFPIKTRREMALFTNVEPCMMCFGAAINSFIGNVYYSVGSPTDGSAHWAEKSWGEYHTSSVFKLPQITRGILADEARALLLRYLQANSNNGYSEWVKTLL